MIMTSRLVFLRQEKVTLRPRQSRNSSSPMSPRSPIYWALVSPSPPTTPPPPSLTTLPSTPHGAKQSHNLWARLSPCAATQAQALGSRVFAPLPPIPSFSAECSYCPPRAEVKDPFVPGGSARHIAELALPSRPCLQLQSRSGTQRPLTAHAA